MLKVRYKTKCIFLVPLFLSLGGCLDNNIKYVQNATLLNDGRIHLETSLIKLLKNLIATGYITVSKECWVTLNENGTVIVSYGTDHVDTFEDSLASAKDYQMKNIQVQLCLLLNNLTNEEAQSSYDE